MTFQSEKSFDWPRIQHLLKLGIFASVIVLIGDMLLGWGMSDPSVTELPAMFTRYLSVSEGRIFASALLGLIGIPIECLCWFAIYRMLTPTELGSSAAWPLAAAVSMFPAAWLFIC